MRKQRCIAGILAIGLLPGILAGCSGKKTALDPDNPVRITVWHYYTGAQLEAFGSLVEEFNRTKGKELGIVVEESSEGGVSDLETNVLAAINKEPGAQEVPNIFACYTDTAYMIHEMTGLVDLSAYLSEEERAEYVDSYIEEGAFQDDQEIMIFPVAKATEIYFLNKTDWDKFAQATGAELAQLSTMEGLVETAEDYYEWTDSLTPEPDDGKAFFGRDSIANYMITGVRQLGTEFFVKDESGKTTLNFPEETVRKLWDYYYVPYINGYFVSEGRFCSDDVKTGTIISFVESSAGATFFPKEVILEDDSSYPIETMALAAPQFEGGEQYAIQQGAGMAVTKGSEAEMEASAEFLKWFTDTQQNVRFAVASGYLPVKKEANKMTEIQKTEELDETVEDVMKVAIDTLTQNHLVYSAAFENAADARKILEYRMSDKAAEDRALIEEEIASGTSRQEAVEKYDTDENFQKWYEAVKKELEALIPS